MGREFMRCLLIGVLMLFKLGRGLFCQSMSVRSRMLPLFSNLLGKPSSNAKAVKSDEEFDDRIGSPLGPMPTVSSKINYGNESPTNIRYDLWVVGAGTLGEIVCRKYKQKHPDSNVIGETATEMRHENLISLGVTPRLNNQRSEADVGSARNMVISLTPSACPDYAGAINDAIRMWAGPLGGGTLVFTSSLAVYGESNGNIVNETFRLDTRSQRSLNLIAAEEAILSRNGVALRLAGLYNDYRGPHSYWLKLAKEGKIIETNADGLVNMIHYEDAADLVIEAVNSKLQSIALIGVDNEPITKLEICMSALASKLYPDCPVPQFQSDSGPIGKRCDGSYTKSLLKWQPKFSSFRRYMRSLGGEEIAETFDSKQEQNEENVEDSSSVLWIPGRDADIL